MKQQDSQPPSPNWTQVTAGPPTSKAVVGGLPWANERIPPAQSIESEPFAGRPLDGLPRARDAARPDLRVPPDSSVVAWLGEQLARLVHDSPAFSISLSVHCLLLLLLAIWVVRERPIKKLRLTLAFGPAAVVARETGIDVGPPAKEPVVEPAQKTEIAETELRPVEKPMAAPAVTLVAEVGRAPIAAPLVAPAVGMLLTGRDAGRKRVLLGAAGGSSETEAAVALALNWLKRQQSPRDGLWSLTGEYTDGGSQENRLAASAMALMAFQGAGNTLSAGPHSGVVARGWNGLLKTQQKDGSFDVGSLPGQHKLYSHAQTTMALCEIYGMTHDPKLAEPAARAIEYCVAAQGPNGGWRYEPGQPGDMSVTGWFMMALKTAEMADLEVPRQTLENIGQFLESVANEKGTRYGYLKNSALKPASPMTAAVTAEGLLCRQYLGWPQRDPRLVEGLELLMADNLFDFENNKDVYAWYYITQVAHHMEGEPWQRWNDRLRDVLPREQVAKGRETGSWDPSLDHWGHIGGRLFVTCFCTYMLEVYYRHLPLYSGLPAAEE